MRRADRLFQIVQLLRRSTVVTAAELAVELEVSERTIYRDVADLSTAGVPVQGEAGVGYALPASFELPPLMFTAAEVEALALGARMVQGWSDDELAASARSALRKIEHVLPPELEQQLANMQLHVPAFTERGVEREILPLVRRAQEERRRIRTGYTRADGQRSERVIRPLALCYWGKSWTLTAWCEHRDAFRNFRVDRMWEPELTDDVFESEAGKRFEDFLALMEAGSG